MYYLEIQALFKDLCHTSSTFQGKQSNSRAFEYCANPVIECFCFVKSHLLWKSSLRCGRTRDNLENTKNRVTEHSGEGMVSQGRCTNLEEEERGQSSWIHNYHLQQSKGACDQSACMRSIHLIVYIYKLLYHSFHIQILLTHTPVHLQG